MDEDDLIYSKEALEAKAAFYSKDFTVYVEGKDDLIFWDTICRHAKLSNYHIEDVGGEPINRYKKMLEEDDKLGFIVACDSNFEDFKKRKFKSKKIVQTYGHSIENSMYRLIEKIDNVVKKYTKTLTSYYDLIKQAVINFTSTIFELVIYDIANELYNRSLSILTNNCTRFLKRAKSYELCETRINLTISKIGSNFSEKEIIYCKKKLKKDIWFYVRGHFLTTWIYKLIKVISERSGNVDVSYDAIYSEFIQCSKDQSDVKVLVKLMKAAKNTIYMT